MPSTTTKYALPKPLSSEAPDGPAQIGALADAVDSNMAGYAPSTLAARPGAGKAGRFIRRSDGVALWFDNGAGYDTIVLDTDARLADARTPLAHKTTHLPTGTDPLTTAAPGSIQPDDAAAVGTANSFARSDHKHAIVAAAPGAIQPDDAAAEGAATSFARSDHKHAIVAAAPGSIQPDDAAAEGASTSFARADHKHAIVAAPAVALDGTNAEGTSTSFARADHKHAYGAASVPDSALESSPLSAWKVLAQGGMNHGAAAGGPWYPLRHGGSTVAGGSTSTAPVIQVPIKAADLAVPNKATELGLKMVIHSNQAAVPSPAVSIFEARLELLNVLAGGGAAGMSYGEPAATPGVGHAGSWPTSGPVFVQAGLPSLGGPITAGPAPALTEVGGAGVADGLYALWVGYGTTNVPANTVVHITVYLLVRWV